MNYHDNSLGKKANPLSNVPYVSQPQYQYTGANSYLNTINFSSSYNPAVDDIYPEIVAPLPQRTQFKDSSQVDFTLGVEPESPAVDSTGLEQQIQNLDIYSQPEHQTFASNPEQKIQPTTSPGGRPLSRLAYYDIYTASAGSQPPPIPRHQKPAYADDTVSPQPVPSKYQQPLPLPADVRHDVATPYNVPLYSQAYAQYQPSPLQGYQPNPYHQPEPQQHYVPQQKYEPENQQHYVPQQRYEPEAPYTYQTIPAANPYNNQNYSPKIEQVSPDSQRNSQDNTRPAENASNAETPRFRSPFESPVDTPTIKIMPTATDFDESLQASSPGAKSPFRPGSTIKFISEESLPTIAHPSPLLPPSFAMQIRELRANQDPILFSDDYDRQLDWALSVVKLSQTCRERFEQDDLVMLSLAENLIPHLEQLELPKLLYYLGVWSLNGEMDMSKDESIARAYFDKAAESGYARAWYRIGMIFEVQQRYDDAVDAFIRGQKDAGCCYALGMIYLKGLDNEKPNYETAIKYLKIAADGADEEISAPAYIYGQILIGEDSDWRVPASVVTKDVKRGRRYIERAALLGSSAAQVRMGIAWQSGELDCEYDPAISLHYYMTASRLGDSEGFMGLSSWFVVGDDVFAKDERRAYEYAQKAAELGNARGYFALGYYHEVGIYVSQDPDEAQRLYRIAASMDCAEAKQRLDAQHSFNKTNHEQRMATRRQTQRSLTLKRRQRRSSATSPVTPIIEVIDEAINSMASSDPPAIAVPSPTQDGGKGADPSGLFRQGADPSGLFRQSPAHIPPRNSNTPYPANVSTMYTHRPSLTPQPLAHERRRSSPRPPSRSPRRAQDALPQPPPSSPARAPPSPQAPASSSSESRPTEQSIPDKKAAEERQKVLDTMFQPLPAAKRRIGPKTFEEMGIPRSSKGQDCRVM